MQKVQPAKNTLDMDFLNSFDKPIGGSVQQNSVQTVTQAQKNEPPLEYVTEIDPTSTINTDFEPNEFDIEDEVSVSRTIKATQIVVRTTENEREALKAYFMKHGVSLSKGIKIAIKYLEQQEKKGLVQFSDIGLY